MFDDLGADFARRGYQAAQRTKLARRVRSLLTLVLAVVLPGVLAIVLGRVREQVPQDAKRIDCRRIVCRRFGRWLPGCVGRARGAPQPGLNRGKQSRRLC